MASKPKYAYFDCFLKQRKWLKMALIATQFFNCVSKNPAQNKPTKMVGFPIPSAMLGFKFVYYSHKL